MHHQLESHFAENLTRLRMLPSHHQISVFDANNVPCILYTPKLCTTSGSFLHLPSSLHNAARDYFRKDGPFTAGRRFKTHQPQGSHHGISGVSHGILQSYSHTSFALLSFFSPLAIAIQRSIKEFWPEVWQWILERLPAFTGIGGSIFQTIALNYRTNCALHRDVADRNLSWTYYFDDFSRGEVEIPEMEYAIPVQPRSLLGLNGNFFFHRAAAYAGERSCVTLYFHYSKDYEPKYSSISPNVIKLQHSLNWKYQ